MNLIELARHLGEEIQNDEVYIKVRMAEQKLEIDKEFQKLLSVFNEEKAELNEQIAKKSPDREKVQELNLSLQEKYEQISKNPNMIVYRQAQEKLNDIIKRISGIILKSAQGGDPYSDEDYGCTGDCSGCHGCG